MSEITKPKGVTAAIIDRTVWLLLAVAAVAVYFYGLNIPLLGPDEPRYAQVAREMFERNDWVTPTLGGANWFEKPSLLYWLEIVSYKMFGVSEFAARFGSAVFGLLTVLSLYLLGKFCVAEARRTNYKLRIANHAPENSQSEIRNPKSDFSEWLFLISASSIGLLVFSRAASFDIVLTFPLTASLVAFFIFDRSERKKSLAYYASLAAFYFFVGLALLAKGLIGVVFPFAIVAFYYVLIRKLPSKPFIFSLFWGTVLSLAIAATWYVPMYLRHGWTFIDEFFIQHHFARYTSNKYLHPQPFYFFLWVLPLLSLPWLPFFLLSIWNFIKKTFNRREAKSPKIEMLDNYESGNSTLDSRLSILALAWMIVPLVFFSFSGSKLPGYILPALPGALILAAQGVSNFIDESRKRKWALQILAVSMLIFSAAAVHLFASDYVSHETVKNLIGTADARGYRDAKIVNLHMVSHNAEFYAAGRLIRADDGKIRYFSGVSDMVEEIERQNSKAVLVMIPLEYAAQLEQSDRVAAEKLSDNGETAIFAVNLRKN